LHRRAPVKKHLPLLAFGLVAGCVGAAEREARPAGVSAPTLLRLHGAITEGIELMAVGWVSSEGGDACWGDPANLDAERAPREFTGPESLAVGRGDVVSRSVRSGTEYVLDIPWRWSSGACTYHLSNVAVHASTSPMSPDTLGGAVLHIGKHRMSRSTNVADIGALSCRPDPFSTGGLTCRRGAGIAEPESDDDGLTFFNHVEEPDPSSADPDLIDVPLAVLGRREFCQATSCDRGCDPGTANCYPSDCDATRDCVALSSFRQDAPIAIAARGALVTRGSLVVEGEAATPAALADLVLDLDYMSDDELDVTLLHADGRRVPVFGPGAVPAPRFGFAGRGQYQIQLPAEVATSPAGTWTLEVRQRRPFFTGAVLSWGIDLYR
jgi:hypothetical protein